MQCSTTDQFAAGYTQLCQFLIFNMCEELTDTIACAYFTWDVQGVPKKITHFFSRLISKRNNSETVCDLLLRFDVRRVPIGNFLHMKF